MFFVMTKEMTFWIVLPSVGEKGTIPRIFKPGKTKMQAQSWQGSHRRRVIPNTSEDSKKSPEEGTRKPLKRVKPVKGRLYAAEEDSKLRHQRSHRRRSSYPSVFRRLGTKCTEVAEYQTESDEESGKEYARNRRSRYDAWIDSQKLMPDKENKNSGEEGAKKPLKGRLYADEGDSNLSVFSRLGTKNAEVEYQTESDEESTEEFEVMQTTRYDAWMDTQELPDNENKSSGEEGASKPLKTVKPVKGRLYAHEEGSKLSVFSRLGTKNAEVEYQTESDEESTEEFEVMQTTRYDAWMDTQELPDNENKSSGEEGASKPLKTVKPVKGRLYAHEEGSKLSVFSRLGTKNAEVEYQTESDEKSTEEFEVMQTTRYDAWMDTQELPDNENKSSGEEGASKPLKTVKPVKGRLYAHEEGSKLSVFSRLGTKNAVVEYQTESDEESTEEFKVMQSTPYDAWMNTQELLDNENKSSGEEGAKKPLKGRLYADEEDSKLSVFSRLGTKYAKLEYQTESDEESIDEFLLYRRSRYDASMDSRKLMPDKGKKTSGEEGAKKPLKGGLYADEEDSKLSVFSRLGTKYAKLEYESESSEESAEEFLLYRRSRYDAWMDTRKLIPDLGKKTSGEEGAKKPSKERLYADEEDSNLRLFNCLGTKYAKLEYQTESGEKRTEEFLLYRRSRYDAWMDSRKLIPEKGKKRSGEEGAKKPLKGRLYADEEDSNLSVFSRLGTKNAVVEYQTESDEESTEEFEVMQSTPYDAWMNTQELPDNENKSSGEEGAKKPLKGHLYADEEDSKLSVFSRLGTKYAKLEYQTESGEESTEEFPLYRRSRYDAWMDSRKLMPDKGKKRSGEEGAKKPLKRLLYADEEDPNLSVFSRLGTKNAVVEYQTESDEESTEEFEVMQSTPYDAWMDTQELLDNENKSSGEEGAKKPLKGRLYADEEDSKLSVFSRLGTKYAKLEYQTESGEESTEEFPLYRRSRYDAWMDSRKLTPDKGKKRSGEEGAKKPLKRLLYADEEDPNLSVFSRLGTKNAVVEYQTESDEESTEEFEVMQSTPYDAWMDTQELLDNENKSSGEEGAKKPLKGRLYADEEDSKLSVFSRLGTKYAKLEYQTESGEESTEEFPLYRRSRYDAWMDSRKLMPDKGKKRSGEEGAKKPLKGRLYADEEDSKLSVFSRLGTKYAKLEYQTESGEESTEEFPLYRRSRYDAWMDSRKLMPDKGKKRSVEEGAKKPLKGHLYADEEDSKLSVFSRLGTKYAKLEYQTESGEESTEEFPLYRRSRYDAWMDSRKLMPDKGKKRSGEEGAKKPLKGRLYADEEDSKLSVFSRLGTKYAKLEYQTESGEESTEEFPLYRRSRYDPWMDSRKLMPDKGKKRSGEEGAKKPLKGHLYADDEDSKLSVFSRLGTKNAVVEYQTESDEESTEEFEVMQTTPYDAWMDTQELPDNENKSSGEEGAKKPLKGHLYADEEDSKLSVFSRLGTENSEVEYQTGSDEESTEEFEVMQTTPYDAWMDTQELPDNENKSSGEEGAKKPLKGRLYADEEDSKLSVFSRLDTKNSEVEYQTESDEESTEEFEVMQTTRYDAWMDTQELRDNENKSSGAEGARKPLKTVKPVKGRLYADEEGSKLSSDACTSTRPQVYSHAEVMEHQNGSSEEEGAKNGVVIRKVSSHSVACIDNDESTTSENLRSRTKRIRRYSTGDYKSPVHQDDF